jgi:hypothetical protein
VIKDAFDKIAKENYDDVIHFVYIEKGKHYRTEGGHWSMGYFERKAFPDSWIRSFCGFDFAVDPNSEITKFNLVTIDADGQNLMVLTNEKSI